MEYKTFAEIRDKIEKELDLETEDFIQPEEFQEYVNDAIAICEAEIHKLGMEDEYFLTKTTLDLVDGESDLVLPTNIYSNKIKSLQYRNGNTTYAIQRLRNKNRFEDREIISINSGTDYYRYFIRNDSAAAKPVIELIPPSYETVSDALTLWYFRSANKWTDDEDEFCDLPEMALQFVYAYTRYRCYDKEGHPNQAEAKDMVMQTRQLMIDTLTNMVPDEASEMDKDLGIYEDLS